MSFDALVMFPGDGGHIDIILSYEICCSEKTPFSFTNDSLDSVTEAVEKGDDLQNSINEGPLTLIGHGHEEQKSGNCVVSNRSAGVAFNCSDLIWQDVNVKLLLAY